MPNKRPTAADFFNAHPELDPNRDMLRKTLTRMRRDVDDLQKVQQPIYGDYTFTPHQMPFEYVFSTPSSTPISDYSPGIGVLIRNDDAFNNYVIINTFYKQSNWVITAARLQMRFQRVAGLVGSSFVKLDIGNVGVRLNPQRSNNGGGATPEWYTYVNGTVLEPPFNVTVDEYEKEHVFTDSELAQISDGFNSIVVQIESSNPDRYGYGQTVLVIEGYRTAGPT